MKLTSLAAALAIVGLATGGAYAQGSPGAAGSTPGAAAQDGAYCLEGSDGAKNCTFASMDLCEAAKKGASDKCEPNPAATTGSGTTGAGASPMGSDEKKN
jgi:hypothetical protein